MIFLFPKKYVILGSFWSEFGAKIVKYKPLLVHTCIEVVQVSETPKIGLVRLIGLVILLSLTFRHLSDYIFVNIVFRKKNG